MSFISHSRFEEILILLRCDDKSTRAERKEQDKLAAIKNIFEMFVDNCKKAFESYIEITLDEQSVYFRGTFLFGQYVKSKPRRYGNGI